MRKQITRAEFCNKAHVSEHDPMISCFLNSEYLMPASGFAFYEENEDPHFDKYYVRNVDTKELWRISISKIDGYPGGLIDHWKDDDSERFGGHWEFWKFWH